MPILADESVLGPASALEIAAGRAAHGLSARLATCGGLRCARQVDAIARAAGQPTMVGCINLVDDPTVPAFRFEEGWLFASDVPGLGCTVEL